MLNYILGIIEKNGNIKECGNIDVGFSNGSLKIVKKFIYDHIDQKEKLSITYDASLKFLEMSIEGSINKKKYSFNAKTKGNKMIINFLNPEQKLKNFKIKIPKTQFIEINSFCYIIKKLQLQQLVNKTESFYIFNPAKFDFKEIQFKEIHINESIKIHDQELKCDLIRITSVDNNKEWEQTFYYDITGIFVRGTSFPFQVKLKRLNPKFFETISEFFK